jgi:hypothetical protein
MAERLAKRKTEQANQAFRYGIANPPEPQKQGGFGGGIGSNIMNAVSSIASLTPPMQVAHGVGKVKDFLAGKGDYTEPFKTVAAIPKSFESTGLNLVDLLPGIDTKQPGINYVNDWNQGRGITTGLEDIMNIAAVYGGVKGGVNKYSDYRSALAENLAGSQPKLQPFGTYVESIPQTVVEKPRIGIGNDPRFRLSAEQYNRLMRSMNEFTGRTNVGESPFAQGIGETIRNTVQDVTRVNPAQAPKMPPSMMEDYIGRLTSQLDSVPDWMKPQAETKPLTDPFAGDYQPPPAKEVPMSPRRAEIRATPKPGENPVWPEDWQKVDLTKELDLTKKFDNPNRLDSLPPEIRNKWSAQQAFKEQLAKQINDGDLASFPRDFFPPGANTPAQQLQWLEVSSLKDLLSNPIMANDYIDLMRLFGQ